jgi:hypothetical protein
MFSKIVNFLANREEFREELKEYLRDTFIPLDSRWLVFLASQDILPARCWVTSNVMDILTDCLYDDFYIERHETVLFGSIVDRVKEGITAEGEQSSKYTAKFDEMYKKLPEFKEAVLQSGYSGFVYDW